MKELKKIFIGIITLTMLLTAVIPVYSATIYRQDGYSFTDLDNNTVSLCGWDNRTPELIVPNRIGDYYFAEIADFGLRGNTGISKLDLTQTTNLRKIGLYAFADCTELSGEVVFPLRITEIGQSAFENCYQLESVVIYSNVQSIKRQTFYNCGSLTNVQIPVSVNSIEALAFANCGNLSSITILPSVTDISASAFSNDRNLVINCYSDSYAYHYAVENNIKYHLIDGLELGDVNGDGTVDVLDSLTIQKYAVDKLELTEEELARADVNHDEYVDVIDALLIQKYTVGKYNIE